MLVVELVMVWLWGIVDVQVGRCGYVVDVVSCNTSVDYVSMVLKWWGSDFDNTSFEIFSFLHGENPINILGSKRLSRTDAHLLIMADPLGPTVGKYSLIFSWAGMHLRAKHLQQTSLPNFQGTFNHTEVGCVLKKR